MEKIDKFEQFDALVNKFLRHEMTSEEELAFKSELMSDSEKLERAKITALMVKKMQDVGNVRESHVVDYIQDMSEAQFRAKLGLQKKSSIFMIPLVRFAVAASFLGAVFGGGYRYMLYNDTVTLGSEQYLAYTPDLSEMQGVRGQKGILSPRDSSITVYSELKELFTKVENSEGISNAITQLCEIYNLAQDENSSYNEFLDDISWNLAIAYLKDGNRKDPIPILEGMLKRNQGYPEITDSVEQLIEKIKDL